MITKANGIVFSGYYTRFPRANCLYSCSPTKDLSERLKKSLSFTSKLCSCTINACLISMRSFSTQQKKVFKPKKVRLKFRNKSKTTLTKLTFTWNKCPRKGFLSHRSSKASKKSIFNTCIISILLVNKNKKLEV